MPITSGDDRSKTTTSSLSNVCYHNSFNGLFLNRVCYLALQTKLNEEKSLRQKFESQCQEKERQISMINVDYRQLMQQIQKIEGELRQETDKTKALKVQLEEDVNKRFALAIGTQRAHRRDNRFEAERNQFEQRVN